ncbi:SCO2322 family protein [Streptomyces sp. B6B3]|uniref:SCO2322 family protein n=1 Tax=Streptomyces sp. B6B3 TaxID=3153570 RepID=UPI00325F4590
MIGRVIGALRGPGALAAAGAVLATTALFAAPARADGSGYRYWSFWEGAADGAWAYAAEGPGTARTHPGDVLGFRFAVSQEASDAHQPRGAADFAAICGADGGGDDQGVALVIDFGERADAPDGDHPPEPRTECARVPDGATAAEALAEVAEPLRYNADGLLCAIAGYPEQGCGEQLTEGGGAGDEAGDDTAADDAGGGGGPVAIAAGIGVVLLLATAAARRGRRGRQD